MNTGIMKKIGLTLRILICAGLLYFVFRQTNVQVLFQALRTTIANWPWILAGILLTGAGLSIAALRWKEIITTVGIRIAGRKVIEIFFIGQFFNAFLLGACGGDIVRAYYVARGRHGKKAEAITTVFLDRAVGLFVMIIFCCLMIVFRLRTFLDNEGTRQAGVLMVVFLVICVAGIVVLFRQHLFEHFKIFQKLESSTRLGPLIRRTYDALYIYRCHPRVMAISIAFSLLNLAFLTLACYSFGHALGIKIPLIDYFTFFPVISVLSAIPITPGSLGVRESLFISLFGAVMVAKSHAVLLSLMVYFGSLAWCLLGGLIYLRFSHDAAQTDLSRL